MPSRKDQDSVEIHGDLDDMLRPPSLAAVAQMAGWWPGMGTILIPKDINVPNKKQSGRTKEEMIVRVRSAESIERELEENFIQTDSAGSGFSMMTGSQRRFLESLAEEENKKARQRKRRGFKNQVKNYLEEVFPFANYGSPYKFDDPSEPVMFENILGYNEAGEPQVEVGCIWTPQQLRSKVQQFVQSSDCKMTIAELCQQMETTQNEYCEFMKKQSFDGEPVPDFFFQAAYFFAKKDYGFVPIDKKASKKRKVSSNDDGNNDDGASTKNGTSKRAKTSNKNDKAGDKTSAEPGVNGSTRLRRSSRRKGTDKEISL